MSVVRDPAFWKRFSVAVHLDEEAAAQSTVASPISRPELKHTESWLAREQKKRRRSYLLVAVYSILFLAVIAVVVAVLVYLAQHGWSKAFRKGGDE
ncbi:MAG: hypothetical protein FRX48_00737 [Lasallia pustulata]|uniref:Uncharacterized protein n=1 Tax=Lasallia pustulata TaxID=136370 RepID=A0A1W5DDC2_9LECA|nr:MAG: hypothetical protein FRX48_00737 [Lasallia pustulata]SLM41174.1 hypothetical protein LPUS_12110 [Lasallia pustulata]